MIIRAFDHTQGVYSFREAGLVTGLHAHPVGELIFAHEGSFDLSGPGYGYKDVTAMAILPNQLHALSGQNAVCDLIMVEPGFIPYDRLQALLPVPVGESGIFPIDQKWISLLSEKWSEALPGVGKTDETDHRVKKTMELVRGYVGLEKISLSWLADQVHLSPGRLTHLFSSELGIPIQRFILWERLKFAVNEIVWKKSNLTDAALAAGFFDTAHFSRTFKAMMGIKPSEVYNSSRIVQAS